MTRLPEAHPESSPPPAAAPTPPPLRVLVVEDNRDLRSCIREVFEMAGFLVDTAGNGLDAVSRASARRFDVVVSDIQLPGMNGLSVARSLATHPCPPRILLITAYPDWKVLKEAREAGVDHVVNKPLDLRKLSALVWETAASHRLHS